jgi:hypothetical protein
MRTERPRSSEGPGVGSAVAPSLPVQQAPSAVTANPNSGAIHVFVTGHGSTTSLFPPNANASSGG